MKIVRIALGALVLLVLSVVVIGYMLPVSHTASRERVLPAAPSVVFAAITTPNDFPSWRSNVNRVELLPDVAGKRSYREHDGGDAITYVVEEQIADRRVVTRIADETLPFGGRWTFEITPDSSGTRLRLT